MTKTLDEIITDRVSDCGVFNPHELVEFVITKRDDKLQLTMGCMIYGRFETIWRPIMSLKHLFTSEKSAEAVIEAIFSKKSVNLEHWESSEDPDQEGFMSQD
jgi:hypothetical protein